MGFDKKYPNRKDKRKQYYKSGAVDKSCRPGGSCPWCAGNREHNTKKRLMRSKDSEKEKDETA
jgi:hypothetical protein